MLPPLPRCSSWVYSSLFSPSRVSLPRFHGRIGLHIVLFEVCSAFTRVAACTLARLPYVVTAIRRLQTLRLLHVCDRELDRLELLLKQIKTVEGERDALLAAAQTAMPAPGPHKRRAGVGCRSVGRAPPTKVRRRTPIRCP